jgi:hypothetical protein
MSGCTNDSSPVQNPASDLQLRTIVSKSAPPEKKQMPMDSAINQVTWELSNYEKVSPSEQNVQWEATFLSNSVVVLKVPVTDPWYNIVYLTQKGQEWTMVGLADMHVKEEDKFSNKEGLALPLESFAVSKISLGSEDNNAWAFADDQKQVIIGKYPHDTPFSVLENAKLVHVNGIEAWSVTRPDRSLLYYIDQGHVIWLTGNMNESELLTLANSLPSATFFSFPFSKPTADSY